MPERPPLVEKLRQADEALRGERLSPEADRRIRERLVGEAPGPRPWLRWVWAPVAAAAVVVLIWALWPRHRPPSPGAPRPRPRLAGFSLERGEVDREREGLRCRTAACILEAPGFEARLALKRRCVVARRQGGIRLERGELTVEVDPRARRERPVRIIVSHGVVEVTGTRFTLRQDPRPSRGGWVELDRGAVRFVSTDGREVALRPGQRLEWPLAPPREPPTTRPTAPAEPAPKRPRPEPLDEQAIQALLEQVERLRSQQRYARAARLLGRSLPRVADRTTRERLSYELGSLLTYQLERNERACRHWSRHLRAFSPTRYAAEIARARRRLGCR